MFLFIMLDGVGIGKCDNTNILYNKNLKILSQFQGIKNIKNISINNKKVKFIPIDATLFVKGIPQSATSQTTLFTGVNAAKILGEHLSAYPNKKCREVIKENNILSYFKTKNIKCAFLNSYTKEYFEMIEKGIIKHSVTTVMAMSSKQKLYNFYDFKNEKAIYHDITGEFLIEKFGYEFNSISPEKASKILYEQASEFQFSIFEYFLTDLVGHLRIKDNKALRTIEVLDRFIFSLIELLKEDDILAITSDHGNCEDNSSKKHTINKVPLIYCGKEQKEYPKKIEEISKWIKYII